MDSQPNTKIKYTALLTDGVRIGVGQNGGKWVLVIQKKGVTSVKTFSKIARLLRHIHRKFDILPVIFPLNVEITRKTSFDDTKYDVVVFSEV